MQLFENVSLGGLSLANRFIRSATAEGLATTRGYCSPVLSKFMVRLARGGAGLLITGHTAVSREGKAADRQLCLWHDDFIPALVDMTTQVHDAGGKVVMQLSHAGIRALRAVTKEAAMGPMLRRNDDATLCRAMTRKDIRETVRSFALAAARAKTAGFDGVQVHAAHGYLLSAFLSPAYNRRRDEYGGTVNNRARFLIEVIEAVSGAVGPGYPVLVKLNASDYLPDGLTSEQMMEAAKLLETTGICAIELSGGTKDSGVYVPARPGRIAQEDEGYYRNEASRLKAGLKVPVILVGGIRSLEKAADLVANGVCDFVGLARPFIREPDLIARWKTGDRRPSSCDSDNLCYRPVQAGKGLYCLTKARATRTAVTGRKTGQGV